MHKIRPPAVAGMFYPGDAAVLRRDVLAMLEAARPEAMGGHPAAAPHPNPPPPAGEGDKERLSRAVDIRPKAIIAPHAGYIYSGPVAASAYALLAPLRGRIKRVVLLGPVHRVWVAGLALPGVEAFDTPLGRIELDQVAIAGLAALPQVETRFDAHAMEHSLEVHLPFLQAVLGDFKLVPLAVGGASAQQVAEVLDTLWGGDDTLIVVSSDLSHFLPYEEARQVDAGTADAIMHLRSDLVGEMACGCHPVNGLMLAARRKGLKPHLLDLRSSGDTAGDRSRVVGYGAFAFTEED